MLPSDANTIKGSFETANMAGMESRANNKSGNSITAIGFDSAASRAFEKHLLKLKPDEGIKIGGKNHS